jgi:hypothetical protein
VSAADIHATRKFGWNDSPATRLRNYNDVLKQGQEAPMRDMVVFKLRPVTKTGEESRMDDSEYDAVRAAVVPAPLGQHPSRRFFLIESDGHRVVYAEHETGLEIVAVAVGAIQAAPIVVGVIKKFVGHIRKPVQEGNRPLADQWRRYELAVEMQKDERGAVIARIPVNGDFDDVAFARRFESTVRATAKALDQP